MPAIKAVKEQQRRLERRKTRQGARECVDEMRVGEGSNWVEELDEEAERDDV